MQKIAIPVLDDKLSPHFTTSLLFKIFFVNDETIIKETILSLPSKLQVSLPVWLAKRGITDLITRQIGQRDINLLNQHKINVFVGVKSENPKDLVQEYINGTLETHDNLIVL
jgi:predicted Fe-Mo cluster-binding NifX family protein